MRSQRPLRGFGSQLQLADNTCPLPLASPSFQSTDARAVHHGKGVCAVPRRAGHCRQHVRSARGKVEARLAAVRGVLLFVVLSLSLSLFLLSSPSPPLFLHRPFCICTAAFVPIVLVRAGRRRREEEKEASRLTLSLLASLSFLSPPAPLFFSSLPLCLPFALSPSCLSTSPAS